MNKCKQSVIKNIFLGGLIGIAIGHLISLFWSVVLIADGNFYPTTPHLMELAGGHLSGTLAQVGISAYIGIVFSVGSVVWEIEHWSLLKQTVVYFFIGLLAMLPSGYIAGWFDFTSLNFISFILIYIVIFIINWLIFYIIEGFKIRALNKQIEDFRK